jgi:hypothetical protein
MEQKVKMNELTATQIRTRDDWLNGCESFSDRCRFLTCCLEEGKIVLTKQVERVQTRFLIAVINVQMLKKPIVD